MATTAFRKVSYAELQELPRNDSRIVELIEGEIFMTPSPNTRHQRAAGRLFRALSDFVERNELGEVFIAPYDIVFSKWTALEPDLLFIRRERFSIITEANVQGVPDLVIEILSPSRKAYDRRKKLTVYEKAGVPELWYFDPEDGTAEILELGSGGRYVLAARLSGNDAIVTKILPKLALTLGEVFGT
ncbi:MAG TPA: Uma2 family endonuclease, partial [Thermoanaerobaculia bacterium]|nr:Uma2 family endonuclease [Thermoanaerobaculia bacterium]